MSGARSNIDNSEVDATDVKEVVYADREKHRPFSSPPKGLTRNVPKCTINLSAEHAESSECDPQVYLSSSPSAQEIGFIANHQAALKMGRHGTQCKDRTM